MGRKRILWLCSWYPSVTDPFNGDFIQRHAHAAALYNDIYVIHVAACQSEEMVPTDSFEKNGSGLAEQILYFSKKNTLVSRIRAHYKWYSLFKRAIREYIDRNGLPDIVHVQIPMRAGLLALWIKQKYGCPFVVTEHWGIYNDVELLNYKGRSRLFKKYTYKIFKEASSFMSVSRFLAEGVNSEVVKKEYTIVPNVVDTNLFKIAENKGGKRFRFIHVSNMVPLKNGKGILNTFSHLLKEGIDAELVMVGNPDQSLPNYAEEIGLTEENVIFKGEIAYKKVAEEMQLADTLLVFSDIENSPCVIGEALCCGLPVIATRTGGIPEMIDEENGILVYPRDEQGLMNAMIAIMNDPDKYDSTSISGKASMKYSYVSVGEQLNDLYTAVLKKN